MGQATYAYFARPDDDFAPRAISVVASAEDPDYLATNLIAENAAKPAKLTSGSGNWVLSFSAAITPVAAILYYQYLDAGLDVKIQGNASNSWGSPAFETDITIPAKRRDGPTSQHWTENAAVIIDTDQTYQYWRLLIAGTNSQNVAVGRLALLTNYHAVEFLLSESMDENDEPEGQIVQPTELGVETVYTIGGPRRSLSGVVALTDASGVQIGAASEFRDLQESSEGRAHPFILFPFGLSAPPWLVRFEQAGRQRTHKVGNVQYWPFSVREVSRGLPWP